jgi:hypothetical protein
MKSLYLFLACALVSILSQQLFPVFAQGPLVPPGPPGPTMKSLSEIEPRVLLNPATMGSAFGVVEITNSGSYYLGANLAGQSQKDGIRISAADVTLDLNGFSVTGNGGDNGIAVFGSANNVTIRNGTVRGWGIRGIWASQVSGTRVEKVVASGNYRFGAIYLGPRANVLECRADDNASVGILVGSDSTIVNSSANGTTNSPGTGISTGDGCTLTASSASGNSGDGIEAGKGCSLDRCVATGNGGSGISAGNGCSLTACTAIRNTGGGILAGFFTSSGCNLSRCVAESNGGPGLVASDGRVSDCSARMNGTDGIALYGGLASGCNAQGNTNYGIYVAPGIVSGCYVQGNQKSGIYVNQPGSQVIGNTCIGNNLSRNTNNAGIFLNDANNRIEGNQVTANGNAPFAVGGSYGRNLIIRNSFNGVGVFSFYISDNLAAQTNQIIGPLLGHSYTSSANWTYATDGDGKITTSLPWVNFVFDDPF